jgi:hypothetical protein
MEKYKVTTPKQKERTELDLCIDHQFECLKPFIKRVDRKTNPQWTTIYDEVDPKAIFDIYGRMLPTRLDAWSTDPAYYENHFGPNK